MVLQTYIAAVLLICVSCIATLSAQPIDYEPYSFSWVRSADQGRYAVRSLCEAQQKAGIRRAHFGFVTGDSKNDLHPDVIDAIPDMKSFVNRGGHLSLSFGGASGCYLETIQSIEKMTSTILWLLDQTGAQAIDFDVEGSRVVSDWRRNEIRVKAIVNVQRARPQLRTSMTVAGGPGVGMPEDVFNMVRYHRDLGMRIDIVNTMLMDYGAIDGMSFADASIKTLRAVSRQIKMLYPREPNTFSKMAGTLMCGRNDDSNVCSIEDAKQVREFAEAKGMAFLSIWAINRDQCRRGDYNDCSLAQNADFQFTRALMH